jgi:protein-tyrosine-phosphatase
VAEAILNHIGCGRFKTYSAGSSPRNNQHANPLGLQVLAHAGLSVDGLRSKSWAEYSARDAPHWPGKPC